MAPSSSASKVAKLAQKGKGKKVRFQGGTVFPAVIVGVLVLLLPLIVYARQSRPGPGEGAPTINDHWHAALGMYVCDDNGLLELPVLTGNLEVEGTDGLNKYQRTGVHSHDDGVMHWHPFTGAATGTNAKLKVFLNNYDIGLTNSKLTLPAGQGGQVFEEGKTTCKIDGVEKKASLKLWVWDNYTAIDSSDPAVYTTNMGDVRIKNDGMVFVIAFVPDDVDPVAPDYASNLLELGAADGSGAVTPNPVTDTTTAGSGSTAATTAPSTGDTSTDATSTDDTSEAVPTSEAASTATTGG